MELTFSRFKCCLEKSTAAYQEKDLHTLLKLEIEIIYKQSENLDHLTDEKLKFLNSALKEQIIELKEELIGDSKIKKEDNFRIL
jgi:hypothetical protein